LGINVLASLLTDEGTWLLHKGFRTKGDCLYFEKRVANVRSPADKAMEMGKAERARSIDGEEEASQEVEEEATPPLLQTRPSFGGGFLRTQRFGDLQHISKKAPTLREEMNCQPRSLSIKTRSKSVPTGSGELTPDKPIKKGERWNKTSGLKDDGGTVDEAGTSNPSGMRGCQ